MLDDATVILPLAGLFDAAAERANLTKQRAQALAEIERLEAKLADERFTGRAPAQIVEAERDRLAAARARLKTIEDRLAELG